MWFIVLGILLGIYSLFNIIYPGAGVFEAYIIRPLLWIGLAIITIYFAREEGLNILKFSKIRKWYVGNSPIHAGLLIGGFQVSMLIIVGLFAGFGYSPYSFTVTSIARNLFYVTAFLMGTEFSRAYLIKKGTSSRKYATYNLTFLTLVYMFVQISFVEFNVLDFKEPTLALEFLGATLITGLAINLLASYLSYLGGATASISYLGVLMYFEWFSPILPDPHWTLLALVGTIAPAIGFVIIQASITPQHSRFGSRKTRKRENDHSWTAIAIFSVIMVFFSFGYLGVTPSVIYSGSMKPTLDVGDIVLVVDTNAQDIKVGDVIQFVRDNVTYVHRVVDSYIEEDRSVFITKGDANQYPDTDPVLESHVIGKSIFTIPKLGWVQIFVKNMFRSVGVPY